MLIQRTLDQLSSVNILKKDLVESYFFRSEQNLQELQLENKFLHLYDLLSKIPAQDSLDKIPDVVEIDTIGKLYDFRNLYLFDENSRLLYSTDGKNIPENILQKIDSIVRSDPKQLHIIDASPFSRDRHTLLFYYLPIFRNDKITGRVLVQENFQKIQRILFEVSGMGNTGESYLVGKDNRLRSASRFFPDKPPGSIEVKGEAALKSFEGSTGNGVFKDYREKLVLSAYRRINLPDLPWTIFSEIDWDEAVQPIIKLRNYLIGLTLVIVLLTSIITFVLSNAIALPILQLKKTILTLSKGIIPSQAPSTSSEDEIGQMAQAISELTSGLERTSQFAKEIGSRNFDATFTTLSDKDTLGLALISMRDELRKFSEKEVKLVRERAAALLEGQEKERKRIINELHDGVGQLLTAIRMRVDVLDSNDEVKREIIAQLNETIAEVKRISYNVMPQAIVDYGLKAALKGLCDTIERYSALKIDFQYVREYEHELNFEISIAIFRIAQEGLNNIVRHANATTVNLYVLDKEDELYFLLEDNGRGFDDKGMEGSAGYGLRNIKERAKLLNGNADIQSSPGHGVVIEIHIPYPNVNFE